MLVLRQLNGKVYDETPPKERGSDLYVAAPVLRTKSRPICKVFQNSPFRQLRMLHSAFNNFLEDFFTRIKNYGVRLFTVRLFILIVIDCSSHRIF